MIDGKFSKQQFLAGAENRAGARELSDRLAREVLDQLHEVVYSRTREIVEQLNQVGHHLRAYHEPQPGDIAFRDDRQSNGEYQCDLRVAVDVVISVGFQDTIADPGDLDA